MDRYAGKQNWQQKSNAKCEIICFIFLHRKEYFCSQPMKCAGWCGSKVAYGIEVVSMKYMYLTQVQQWTFVIPLQIFFGTSYASPPLGVFSDICLHSRRIHSSPGYYTGLTHAVYVSCRLLNMSQALLYVEMLKRRKCQNYTSYAYFCVCTCAEYASSAFKNYFKMLKCIILVVITQAQHKMGVPCIVQKMSQTASVIKLT
jgi:hypothetical protein